MEEKIFYDSNNIKLCGILNEASTDKMVVLCHGIRGNKDEQQLIDLADILHKEGYSSFRFDFNGHGESEGKDYEMTISKEMLDVKNTIEMLKEKGYKEFVLLGESFAAGIISLLSYEKYDFIKGLVLWYGALDYDYIKYGNLFSEDNKEIAKKNGFYISKTMSTGEEFKFGLELFDEIYRLKPYEELKKNKLPKIFVHGEIDSAVPYKVSEEVAALCGNAKFELIKNGEHTFQNAKEAMDKAVDVTLSFIKSVL